MFISQYAIFANFIGVGITQYQRGNTSKNDARFTAGYSVYSLINPAEVSGTFSEALIPLQQVYTMLKLVIN